MPPEDAPRRPFKTLYERIDPSRASDAKVFAALFLLWIVLTLPGLGIAPLFDWDEAAHAETAVEMLRNGTWLLPAANGQPFYEKPALMFYFLSASLALFGTNAFAARLPSALFTLATALFLLRAGRRMGRPGTGMVAALIYVSMLMPALLAHTAILDATLNFWMTVSVLSFFLWRHEGRPRDALVAAFAAGIAVSVKGPVGAVIPVLVIVLDRLMVKDLVASLRAFPWAAGTPLFLAGAAPWYALVTLVHGFGFLKQFILVENLGRFANPMEGHSGGWYYYLLVLIPSALPWTVWLPWWLAQVLSRGKEQGAADPLSRLGLVWAAAVVILFSLSGTKLPHYISSMYPAAALGIAGQWLRREPAQSWTRATMVILAIVCVPLASLLIALPALYPHFAAMTANPHAVAVLSRGPGPGAWMPAAGVAVAASLAVLLRQTGRARSNKVLILFILFGLILQSSLIWSLAPWAGRLMQEQKMTIAAHICAFPRTEPLYSMVNAPSISFYSGRSYAIVNGLTVRERLAASAAPCLLIARREHLPVLSPVPLEVVTRQGDLLLFQYVAASERRR